MGCNSSKSSETREPANEQATGTTDPVCHFCGKAVPEREYNAHTVQCDEREVTCWHSWCRKIIKQGELQAHMEMCARNQKTICAKCGMSVLVMDLQNHRDSCSLVQCPHCPEKVIGRIVKYCPVQHLGKVQIATGPFATKHLHKKYLPEGDKSPPMAHVNLGVARMQHLWRWAKTKNVVEELIFRLIHKEMDLKKEGFAIFKAHDRYAEAHVLAPKRSRSIMQQPVVPASSQQHYFPSKSNLPISEEHIRRMIKDLCTGTLLPYPAAWRIFTDAMNHFNTLPNVQRLAPPAGARRDANGRWHAGGKVVIVGDLHGQLADLLHILGENGMPSETTFYIFNGDFVDRGQFGVEILLILFSLMIAYPKYVALNRGNHECDYMNEEYGFDVEVSTKYDRNVFRLIQRCFCAIPLATIVGTNVFVVHGGLPRRKGITMHDLSRIQRFRQIPMPEHAQPEEDEIFQDLLWSDPWENKGWQESERGAGVRFGKDVTESFCKTNGFDLVIRSHEEFAKGYEEHHDSKLITVFSASNYDGPETNSGAFMWLSGVSSEPSFHTHQVYDDDFGSFAHDAAESVQTPTSLGVSFSKTQVYGQSFYGGGMFRRDSHSQASVPRIRRTRDEVLRVLRERIYQRRHRLLAYFTKLDRTQKGSVWKIEWVETMRNVLNLNLPWFFLRRYIAREDENHRIEYADFLSNFHNGLQQLWLKEWEQSMAFHITMLMRTSHRVRHLHSAFGKEMVNYNEFCSVMRAVDYSLSDACLFQLFLFFDRDLQGHINGEQFLQEIDEAVPTERTAIRWDLDTMEQLQNIVIQGRTQLQLLFKISARDRKINHEKFHAGMEMVNKGLKKPIPTQQRDRIFAFIAKRDSQEFTFEEFLQTFSVYDTSRSISPAPLSRIHSSENLCQTASSNSNMTYGLPRSLSNKFFADIPTVTEGSISPGPSTPSRARPPPQ